MPEGLLVISAGLQTTIQDLGAGVTRQALEAGADAVLVAGGDGTVRAVRNLAHPRFDETGTLVKYVGVTLDETERKQAEEALERSETRLRLATEGARVGRTEGFAEVAFAADQPEGAILEVRVTGQDGTRLLA